MIFFKKIGHQPRSTLFPYTTLFRSRWQFALKGINAQISLRERTKYTPFFNTSYSTDFPWAVPTIKRDRKSTRLNSSHSQISYAVFCLKKKITIQLNK